MTNKTLYRKILIPVFFMAFILFAINFQVTLWYGFWGNLPSPSLWPTVFVYLITNRNWKKRILWLGFLFLTIIAHTSAIPLFVFLSLVFIIYLVRFTQKRFSAIDTTDLIGFSLIATFLFPLTYATLATVSFPFQYDIWQNGLSTVFSAPFVPMVLYVAKKIDRIFNIEDEGILLGNI